LLAPVKQEEEWILKLFVLQGSLLGFLAVGFVAPDAKLNLFGVDFKNVDGIREFLLALAATITLFISALTSARDTALTMATAISEQKQDKAFAVYAAFARPSAFNFKIYVPREFDRWIFPKVRGIWFLMTVAILLVVMALIAIVASIAVQIAIIGQIWHHPVIGWWSYAALTYVLSSYTIALIVLVRRSVPFPYVDKSALKGGTPS
jgi:hypothetical protein